MSSSVAAVRSIFAFGRMSEIRPSRQQLLTDECGESSTTMATTAITTSIIRATAHIPPAVAHVRRNLFGPIDHEENARFVQQELCKISTDDAIKWNYDFKNNKPLDGKFNWTKLQDTEVPAAYKLLHMQQSTSAGSAARAIPSSLPTYLPSSIITSISNPSTSTKKSRALLVKNSPAALKARRNLTFDSFTNNTNSDNTSNINNSKSDNINNNSTNIRCSKESEVVINNSKDTINNVTEISSCAASEEESPSIIVPTTTLQRLQGSKTSTRQTSMTDFMKHRKRPRSDSAGSKEEAGTSSTAEDQQQAKRLRQDD